MTASASVIVQPKYSDRRVTSMPLDQGRSASAFGRPLAFTDMPSNCCRASSYGTSNAPPLVSPMKATLAFSSSLRAVARLAAPAVRSAWIAGTATPSSIGPARFRLVCEPPMALPDTGDRRQGIQLLTRAVNDHLERWIRARPESWLWMHRRWPKPLYRRK